MEVDTKAYHIYFDHTVDSVIMKWEGYSTSEEFREGTELMLKVLIENKASKVLADIKNMVLIGLEDQKWLNDDLLPRAIDFGFKAVAVVRPISYFNKIAVETISYKVDKEKLTINFFDNPEDARGWLTQI